MKPEPMLLDLFCGAGGCSKGYELAGFDPKRIIGVDLLWFRHYPYKFVRGGVFELLPKLLAEYPITHIHASPPCQAYSSASAGHKKYTPYADYVERVRELLEDSGLPYVIENVEGAPLNLSRTITLCGTMFQHDVPMTQGGALRVIRHRLFESNVDLIAPLSPRTEKNPDGILPHKPNFPKYHAFNGHPYVHTTRKQYNHYQKLNVWKDFLMVAGGGNGPAAACRDAMGIDWMNRDELSEAIPPVYTRWIGWQLLGKELPLATAPRVQSQLTLF